MPVGYIRALRLLHETFRRHPPRQRAHILGRFLSAPFLRTLDVIPNGARVLDIGSGHGTYARLIVEERAREVIALEPDLRKVHTAFQHPQVRFVCGFDDCIRGEFDVVAMFDVIYRLPPEERDQLFRRVYERVRPGGLFVIKELDPASPWKRHWSRMQESMMDRFFGLTLGEGFYLETRDEVGHRLASAGFTGFQWKRIDAWYPHAHILYTARKPLGSRGDVSSGTQNER